MQKTPILKIRSSIKPSLKKSVLFKGSLFATFGLVIWTYAGLFLPLNTLINWGWILFILGGLFITFGLLPYRKLTKEENNPSEIIVTSDEQMSVFIRGDLSISVPIGRIERILYQNDNKQYGICLWIKRPFLENVSGSINLLGLQQQSQKHHSCDIFLPFFSNTSFIELNELINLN